MLSHACSTYSPSFLYTLQMHLRYLRAACDHQGKLAVMAAYALKTPPHAQPNPNLFA